MSFLSLLQEVEAGMKHLDDLISSNLLLRMAEPGFWSKLFGSESGGHISDCRDCIALGRKRGQRYLVNKLKTTSIPNKSGSYAIKVGVRMP